MKGCSREFINVRGYKVAVLDMIALKHKKLALRDSYYEKDFMTHADVDVVRNLNGQIDELNFLISHGSMTAKKNRWSDKVRIQ